MEVRGAHYPLTWGPNTIEISITYPVFLCFARNPSMDCFGMSPPNAAPDATDQSTAAPAFGSRWRSDDGAASSVPPTTVRGADEGCFPGGGGAEAQRERSLLFFSDSS